MGPGLDNGEPGRESVVVAGGGVTKVLREEGQHGLSHLRVDGRGRIVIQIDGPGWGGGSGGGG